MADTTAPVRDVVLKPVIAPASERAVLADLSALLMQTPKRARPCKLVGPKGEEHILPASVFSALVQLVQVLERGDAVTIVPVEQKLTTQQAANILNISRPYLIRLLDRGEIPFERLKKHRRIRAQDVFDYRATRHAERVQQLDDLTLLGEEMGDYFAKV